MEKKNIHVEAGGWMKMNSKARFVGSQKGVSTCWITDLSFNDVS